MQPTTSFCAPERDIECVGAAAESVAPGARGEYVSGNCRQEDTNQVRSLHKFAFCRLIRTALSKLERTHYLPRTTIAGARGSSVRGAWQSFAKISQNWPAWLRCRRYTWSTVRPLT